MHRLRTPKGAHKPRKLRGRGPGSGHGKTSSRGSKGQTSRTGHKYYAGFEGGQTPMIRRMPKRGFINEFKKKYQIVNIRDLLRLKDETVTPEVLESSGLVKDKNKLIKILGKGQVKKPYVIKAHAFSQKAAAAIAEAGGKTEIITCPLHND
ncbi:MAG: 50S ribosomal protein L15 [Candidatus Omnitrophica bacterium]|nr:50S ribosomal protein L15 [Candidatus Omnitrophota bacterium]